MSQYAEYSKRVITSRGPFGQPALRAYVMAVGAALADRGANIRSLYVSAAVAMRHVDIELTVPGIADRVLLRWDELNGWSRRTCNDGQESMPAFFWGRALPSPADLADWVVMSRQYPVMTSYRDDGPFTAANKDLRLQPYHHRQAS
jgi:Family of unknown function (DUF6292)